MKVVYSPVHRRHAVTFETVMGVQIPANEVVERAEIIRATVEADGGFEIVGPTDHGKDPILAIHDPGLLRFLEEGWGQLVREGLDRQALIPEALAVAGLVEGLAGGRIAEPVA